jgi:hypothetical protein
MSKDRTTIPAEIKRRVLVEAGHRCAIPTCRHIDVEIHHIKPWGECESHEYENLIALCPNCHSRADKGEIDKKSLRIYKANLRYTHDRFSQIEVDMLFELHKNPKGIQWPPYLRLLVKRLVDAKYVELTEHKNCFASIAGMRFDPDLYVISQTGIAFIESLESEKEW